MPDNYGIRRPDEVGSITTANGILETNSNLQPAQTQWMLDFPMRTPHW